MEMNAMETCRPRHGNYPEALYMKVYPTPGGISPTAAASTARSSGFPTGRHHHLMAHKGLDAAARPASCSLCGRVPTHRRGTRLAGRSDPGRTLASTGRCHRRRVRISARSSVPNINRARDCDGDDSWRGVGAVGAGAVRASSVKTDGGPLRTGWISCSRAWLVTRWRRL